MSYVRYAYIVTSALLLSGSVVALVSGSPVTAQTALPVSAQSLAPRGAPTSFADLAERLQPAVVNIATKKKVQVPVAFNPFTGERAVSPQEQQSGGSGFLISTDGYIVTNNHVVTGGPKADAVDSVTVTLFNGKEYQAEIVGRDATSDIALLKIKATDLPFVEMGDSKKSRVGDWVIAIGNPLGLGNTVTAGIISALQRNIGTRTAYDRFIQTDTAINPGNSGGPLFNLDGKVVGINNRLISPIGANIGVGFAIPVDEIISVVDTLKKGVRVERGYLGVGVEPIDENMADALGLTKKRGEFVSRVQAGEPAAKAGLKDGDIVLTVNGQELTPDKTLTYVIANVKPGTKVPLEILREGKPMTINAVVGTRPPEEQLAQNNFNPDEEKNFQADGETPESKTLRQALGLSAIALDPEIARQLGLGSDIKGVVVDVPGTGAAAQAGLRRGDLIVSATYKPITSLTDLANAIKTAKAAGRGAILLGVKRRGAPTQYATVKFES